VRAPPVLVHYVEVISPTSLSGAILRQIPLL